MEKEDYVFYSDYFVNRDIRDKKILVSKYKKAYLIGPLINSNFNENAFYRKVIFNSVCSIKYYKKMANVACLKLINKYIDTLKSNEVLEIQEDGTMKLHKI